MRPRDGSGSAGVRIQQMRQLALVALAGCSFATRGPPRGYDGRADPDCTTSQAAPVLDTSVAIVAGVIGLPLIVQNWGDGCDPNSECHDAGPDIARSIGGVMVAVGLLYAIGAYAGFSNVRDCKAAIAKHRALQPPPQGLGSGG